MSSVLVDSNIPMYLVGADHPNKVEAQRLLEKCILRGDRLVTDAEVLQEIVHRFVAIGRREAIQPALDAITGVVDEVFPIALADVMRAWEVILGFPRLSARDAIHVAVMERHGVTSILTFETGFDEVPGLERAI